MITRHLSYLRVERRLAERTLALYGDAFARLPPLCETNGINALSDVRPQHVGPVGAKLRFASFTPSPRQHVGLQKGKIVVEFVPRLCHGLWQVDMARQNRTTPWPAPRNEHFARSQKAAPKVASPSDG